MKILLVITKSEIGGAQTFVINLARSLRALGQEVQIAGGETGPLSDQAVQAGIQFHRLPHLRRSYSPWEAWQYRRELKRLIKKERFDVVHLNSSNALWGLGAIREAGARSVFTVHGLSVADEHYPAAPAVKRLFRRLFHWQWRQADRLVFVSAENERFCREIGLCDQSHVIHNGLDLPSDYFFGRDEARAQLAFSGVQIGAEAYWIGSIGRLSPQKNYLFLLRLWPEILALRPDARLVIIGDGPERSRYEAEIARFGISSTVFLPGARSEASRLVKAFDLFVLPSLYEGLAISLIEAALAGVPCLASRVGGNREVLPDSSLYELDDSADFLRRFAAGRPEAAQAVSGFRADDMARAYLKLYEV